jgi:hypothetical protein
MDLACILAGFLGFGDFMGLEFLLVFVGLGGSGILARFVDFTILVDLVFLLDFNIWCRLSWILHFC